MNADRLSVCTVLIAAAVCVWDMEREFFLFGYVLLHEAWRFGPVFKHIGGLTAFAVHTASFLSKVTAHPIHTHATAIALSSLSVRPLYPLFSSKPKPPPLHQPDFVTPWLDDCPTTLPHTAFRPPTVASLLYEGLSSRGADVVLAGIIAPHASHISRAYLCGWDDQLEIDVVAVHRRERMPLRSQTTHAAIDVRVP